MQRKTLLERLKHAHRVLPAGHPSLVPLPIPPEVVAKRIDPFVNGVNGETYPIEYDTRQYEVPVWQRGWDGGTGLPIPGMGLPKGPLRGSGRGGSRGASGSNVHADVFDDDEDSEDE